jgi:hypothetical protein
MVKGQFILTGILSLHDQKIALLKEKQSGKMHRVERGKEINGVTLTTVENERVVLAQGGDEEVLTLQVQRGPRAGARDRGIRERGFGALRPGRRRHNCAAARHARARGGRTRSPRPAFRSPRRPGAAERHGAARGARHRQSRATFGLRSVHPTRPHLLRHGHHAHDAGGTSRTPPSAPRAAAAKPVSKK